MAQLTSSCVRRRLIAGITAVLVSAVATHVLAQRDPCTERICLGGYLYHGDERSGRCEISTPIVGWRSYYVPREPICPEGWRLDGQSCVKVDCCYQPACDRDERFRDGRCESGPSGIGGYRSHHAAECPAGWDLNRTTGICRQQGCSDAGARPMTAQQRAAPPPPARRADPGQDPTPRPAGQATGGQPPPPAKAADERGLEAVITGIEQRSCVDKGGVVTIRGARFGAPQGSRLAVLGGHGLSVTLRVVEWTDSRLRLVVPDDPRIENERWYLHRHPGCRPSVDQQHRQDDHNLRCDPVNAGDRVDTRAPANAEDPGAGPRILHE